MGKKSELQELMNQLQEEKKKTDTLIDDLGEETYALYVALERIHDTFDAIRNVPREEKLRYEEQKRIRITWKQQAEKILIDSNKTEMKAAGQGVAGVGAGVAVAALGPTAAMGIATTFGVASTGTAISALSGAAATNAALAWLGGGALAVGGGGMAAGNAFLALAGPIGWAIAGVSIAASGLMFLKTKNDKDKLEHIYMLMSQRDIKSFKLANVELRERIDRIKESIPMLEEAISKIKSFGTYYLAMSESQQYELGAYFNFSEASTQLLINPILGLKPKYTEEDLTKFSNDKGESISIRNYCSKHKEMVITLANQLYKIPLDEKDKKLLCQSLRRNKEFLAAIDMTKSEFDEIDIHYVSVALKHRYKTREC